MPLSKNEEKSLQKIARHVYNWYKEWLEGHDEPETEVTATVDLDKVEGRFELLVLARLFNNPLREEIAIKYFQKLKDWFYSKGFNYRIGDRTIGKIDIRIVRDKNHKLHREFKDLILNEFTEMNPQVRRRNYHGFVRCASAFTEIDLKDYINQIDEEKNILDVICDRLRSAGIFVKSFLIVREMYKAGLWKIDQENLWMCCVPDSKVRGYLNDFGFVLEPFRIGKRQTQYSLLQLKSYAKVIWGYFNEPFDELYFDLPIFRYLKETHEISQEEFEKLKG